MGGNWSQSNQCLLKSLRKKVLLFSLMFVRKLRNCCKHWSPYSKLSYNCKVISYTIYWYWFTQRRSGRQMLSWKHYFLRTIFLPSPFHLLITFREFWLVPNLKQFHKEYGLLFLTGESALFGEKWWPGSKTVNAYERWESPLNIA